MLYKVVLTFESVDEILKCDHSNKKLLNRNFPAVLLACCSLLYRVSPTLESVDDVLKCDLANEKE